MEIEVALTRSCAEEAEQPAVSWDDEAGSRDPGT